MCVFWDSKNSQSRDHSHSGIVDELFPVFAVERKKEIDAHKTGEGFGRRRGKDKSRNKDQSGKRKDNDGTSPLLK